MSWLFGGGKKDDGSSEPIGSYASSSSSSAATDFQDYSGGSSLGGGGGGSTSGLNEIQEFGLALQEQMLVQQAITELTKKAFATCVPSSRDPKLTSKEITCIHSVTNKWIDCNELMMGRLARKQQQGAGGGQHYE